MGQAKLRGTKEERVAQAKEREAAKPKQVNSAYGTIGHYRGGKSMAAAIVAGLLLTQVNSLRRMKMT